MRTWSVGITIGCVVAAAADPTAPTAGQPSVQAAVHAAIPNEYPLPRSQMPDGFGAKVAFQTVTRQDKKTGNKVVSERLVRCGIETDEDGKELFPCNPSFDTRPYIKGLDHVGTGYNALTGERTAPLFEWSVPPWFKPSYDSGAYNYPNKIPEQVTLTSVASGEGGMVTELFESYDQFESKRSFSMGVTFGALGADNALSLASKSERFRSNFDNYKIGISKQQYKLYELEVKPEIFGYCPYKSPIFTAEKIDLEDKSAARPPPSDGIVAEWSAQDVGEWLKRVALGQFAEEFVKRGVTGPLLLTLEDTELTELGVKSTFDKHKLRFELQLARQLVPEKDKHKFLDPAEMYKVDGNEDNDVDEEDEFFDAVEAQDIQPSPAPASSATPSASNSEERLFLIEEKADLDLEPKKPISAPRFVRKWVLRQAFLDAVEAVPILSSSDIAKVCADYDEEDDETAGESDDDSDGEDEKDSPEISSSGSESENPIPELEDAFIQTKFTVSQSLRRGKLSRQRLARGRVTSMLDKIQIDVQQAERAYRRFLHDWGTHWTRSAVMGGEVETNLVQV